MIDIDAFIAQFARIAVRAVGAVARAQNDSSIKAVFIKIRGKEEIAVFIFIRVGAIV